LESASPEFFRERSLLFRDTQLHFGTTSPFSKGLVDLYQHVIAGPTNRGVSFVTISANSGTKLVRASRRTSDRINQATAVVKVSIELPLVSGAFCSWNTHFALSGLLNKQIAASSALPKSSVGCHAEDAGQIVGRHLHDGRRNRSCKSNLRRQLPSSRSN
jgi:hypothetical protein